MARVSVAFRCLAVTLAAFACKTGSGPSPSESPSTASCGNGVRETGEECDDGNADNADGCLTHLPAPGDLDTERRARPHHGLHPPLRKPERGGGAAQGAADPGRRDPRLGRGTTTTPPPSSRAATIPSLPPTSSSTTISRSSRFAAAKTGHLLLLGLDSLEYSSDVFNVPQSGVPIVEWARRQPRAVVGMAHAQYWPTRRLVSASARRLLRALGGRGARGAWPAGLPLDGAHARGGARHASVSGRRCRTPAFASRSPGQRLSCLRSDSTKTRPGPTSSWTGTLTYESWLRAIKAGRTTAADRHREPAQRAGRRPSPRRGGSARRSPGGHGHARDRSGKAADVEILVNGEVAAHVPVAGGLQVAQARVRVSKSSWIAARSPYVLTSPVYVLVGGQAHPRVARRHLLPPALRRASARPRDLETPSPLRLDRRGTTCLRRGRSRAAAPLHGERRRDLQVNRLVSSRRTGPLQRPFRHRSPRGGEFCSHARGLSTSVERGDQKLIRGHADVAGDLRRRVGDMSRPW